MAANFPREKKEKEIGIALVSLLGSRLSVGPKAQSIATVEAVRRDDVSSTMGNFLRGDYASVAAMQITINLMSGKVHESITVDEQIHPD